MVRGSVCIFGLTPDLYFFWARGPLICKQDFTGDPEAANKGACVTPVLDIFTGRPLICISGLGSDPESVVLPLFSSASPNANLETHVMCNVGFEPPKATDGPGEVT